MNEIVDRMPYLNSCIKESLRLLPVGLRIERKAVQNSFLGNIYVPKNCLVNIPVYSVHRDPDNFENPNDFKPERFLDGTKIKAGTYIPFADGPRNCIGQRFALLLMKMTVAKLVHKFSFMSCERTHVRLILLSHKKLLFTFIVIIAGFGIFGGLYFENIETALGSCYEKKITINDSKNIFLPLSYFDFMVWVIVFLD